MKNHQPFFSVVIPALNEGKRLPTLLRMFAAQTFTDFELILVDGKSEDDTKEIVKKYHGPYQLHLIESPKRQPGFQRNLGVEKAHGTYIAFFDADTLIAPDFLEKVAQKITEKNLDFASTRSIPNTGKSLDEVATFLTNLGMMASTAVGKPFMSASNIFMKKSVYQKIGGFDTSVLISDDHELVQRAAKAGYKGELLFAPTHVFSFRRFEREGRLTVTKKYAKAFIYMLLYGPIRSQIYEYQMGGEKD